MSTTSSMPVLAGRRRLGAVLIALAGLLLAVWATSLAPAPAQAAEGDPYRVSGNVQLDGAPLEGVGITVDGPGGRQDTTTDAEGKWSVAVPERGAEYVVTLDESTLPEGIAVVDDSGADETPNVKEVTVGAGGRVAVNFFIGEGERSTTSFLDQFVERFINGINFGLMLGLASVGLTLVYGATGISNFAHAEMVTFGALMAYLFAVVVPWPIWVAIPIAVIASGAFGYVLDAGLWRPLRRKGLGLVQLMIVSIGLSLVLRYIYQMFIGGGTIQLPGSVPATLDLFGSVRLTMVDLASMGISIIVILGFAAWLQRSRIGKATRAIADNAQLAAASGIDVDRVVRVVWVLSGALAGLGGVLWAYFRPGIKWDMGTGILLLIFAAVILGGLGTAYGALIGALIVGVLVEISSLWIPADLKYVAALVILICILLFRPQGILGRRERIG